MDSPRSVGHKAAIAGRSIPGKVFNANFDIAINAPVFPAETAISASRFLTASIASHIDDLRLPERKAWLGLSSMRTANSACVIREADFNAGYRATSGVTRAALPKNRNSISGCRASANDAPATTTSGPWSPPIASSAIRTLCDMECPTVLERVQLNATGSEAGRDNSGSASGNNRHQSASWAFLRAPSAENGVSSAPVSWRG